MIGNPVALSVRTQLREYEIQELVGSGGFGFVYRAKDHTLQRSVALKEYFPASIATREAGGLVRARLANQNSVYQRGLDSFLAEARVLAQFDDPAIVKVHFFWEQNGTAYMVMPFYDGITLRGMLRHHRDLITVEWLKAFILRITEVLGRLHDTGTYHRDLSPENILILESGGLVLLDFGSSRQPLAADLAAGNDVVLKPGYAPIEQYVADHPLGQGPWTDLYGLGAVLHFLLEGKAPPASITRLQQDTYEMLLAKREHYPAVPAKILAAIDHCLAVQPDRRPQSVAKLRELLAISWDRVPEDFDLYEGVGLSTEFAATTRLMAYDDENELTIPLDPTAVLASEGGHESAAVASAEAAPAMPAVEPSTAPASLSTTPPGSQGTQKNSAAAAPRIEGVRPSRRAVWVGLAAFVLFSSVGLWLYLSISPPWKPTLAMASAQTIQLKPSPALEVQGGSPPDSSNATPSTPMPAADGGERVGASTPPPDMQAEVSPPTSGASAPPAHTAPPSRPEPAKPQVAVQTESAQPVPKAAPAAAAAATQSLAAGIVRLNVKPWGTLSVDGQPRGATPPINQLKLAPGKHQIEISNPGFQSYSRELEVLPGATTIVKYQFE